MTESGRTALDLTIVIVSYRCRELLRGCLDSLASDPALHEIRVVVVENDSGDGTAQMLAEQFPWVELHEAGANLGFARANNLVLEGADTAWVLLLNPDTIVPSGAVPACVKAIEAESHAGVIGAKLVRPDGTLDHACKRSFPTIMNSVSYLLRVDRLVATITGRPSYRSHQLGADEVGEVDAVNGAFMLVRTEAMRQVGLLDERFWMYGEDLDWCMRFRQAGWSVLYWPRATVVHVKGGSEGGRRSWRSNKGFHDAMWRFYAKHYADDHSPLLNLIVRAGIGAKLLMSAAMSLMIGRG